MQGLRPLQALLKVCDSSISFFVLPEQLEILVSRGNKSGGTGAKWEEPDLPDIPTPHSLFESAWKKADKSSQRVDSSTIDPGYRFPKPTLFVNVSTPERKKTYLQNWLSARPLWMSKVGYFSPPKFPSPQMWRDFLNSINIHRLAGSSTRSASTKSAVLDILGEDVQEMLESAVVPDQITWRGIQVSVSTLHLWLFISNFFVLRRLKFRPSQTHHSGSCVLSCGNCMSSTSVTSC